MEVTFVILIILSITKMSYGQRIDPPPRLTTDDKELVIESGGNITLTCTGSHPLEWIYPIHLVSVKYQNIVLYLFLRL